MKGLYLSIASTFLVCTKVSGVPKSANLADDAGFSGLQLLPIRGVEFPENIVPTECVCSYENDSWHSNPERYGWGSWKRVFGLASDYYPLPWDHWLFEAAHHTLRRRQFFYETYPDALEVTHDAMSAVQAENCGLNRAWEIHPDKSGRLEAFLEGGWGLVLDTYHIQGVSVAEDLKGENIAPPDIPMTLVNRLMESCPDRVKLVHVHPGFWDVFSLFTRGTWSLTPMLELLKPLDVPFVLEVIPLLPVTILASWGVREPFVRVLTKIHLKIKKDLT